MELDDPDADWRDVLANARQRTPQVRSRSLVEGDILVQDVHAALGRFWERKLGSAKAYYLEWSAAFEGPHI